MSSVLVEQWVEIGPLVTTRRGPVPAGEVGAGDRVACWIGGHLAWRAVLGAVRHPSRPAVRVKTRRRVLLVPRTSSLLRLRRAEEAGRWGERPWEPEWLPANELDRGDPIVVVDAAALDEGISPVTAVGYRGVLGALPDPRFSAERVLAVQAAPAVAFAELQLDGTDNCVADGALVRL